jgi:hypothetical protein
MNETLLLTNLIAGMVITPAPYYPPSAIFHTLPFTEIVPGPGITLTNGWIQWTQERRTGLPGTPREGEVLTTEEVETRPCFAAVYPACPGHAHTNLTRWRWTSGAWSRIWETNIYSATMEVEGETNIFSVSPLAMTNLFSSDSIQFGDAQTNVTIRLPEKGRGEVLLELLRKVMEALKP